MAAIVNFQPLNTVWTAFIESRKTSLSLTNFEYTHAAFEFRILWINKYKHLRWGARGDFFCTRKTGILGMVRHEHVLKIAFNRVRFIMFIKIRVLRQRSTDWKSSLTRAKIARDAKIKKKPHIKHTSIDRFNIHLIFKNTALFLTLLTEKNYLHIYN